MSFTPVRNNTMSPSLLPSAEVASDSACLLNSGLFVCDQLLAAATRENDPAALDAALDFRLVLARRSASPETIIRAFLILRDVVQERHYLACYRLRRWLESQFHARVQCGRCGEPIRVALRLDLPCFDSVCDRCLSAALVSPTQGRLAQLHFVRAADEQLVF